MDLVSVNKRSKCYWRECVVDRWCRESKMCGRAWSRKQAKLSAKTLSSVQLLPVITKFFSFDVPRHTGPLQTLKDSLDSTRLLEIETSFFFFF